MDINIDVIKNMLLSKDMEIAMLASRVKQLEAELEKKNDSVRAESC